MHESPSASQRLDAIPVSVYIAGGESGALLPAEVILGERAFAVLCQDGLHTASKPLRLCQEEDSRKRRVLSRWQAPVDMTAYSGSCSVYKPFSNTACEFPLKGIPETLPSRWQAP